jgi:antitoxin CptB
MDDRRKRIRFRSWRRGFREIDLILGGFADKAVAGLDETSLERFEALLDLSDQDVYDWIVGRAAPPAEFYDLITHIRALTLPADRPS